MEKVRLILKILLFVVMVYGMIITYPGLNQTIHGEGQVLYGFDIFAGLLGFVGWLLFCLALPFLLVSPFMLLIIWLFKER